MTFVLLVSERGSLSFSWRNQLDSFYGLSDREMANRGISGEQIVHDDLGRGNYYDGGFWGNYGLLRGLVSSLVV
jgi:hypothetical protein